MNVHYFQHIPFEGLGSMESWIQAHAARMTATKFYIDTSLPRVRDIDWLIVMGGPMSVNDDQTYPWLHSEKKFIAEAIAEGKVVLGVCLGAQLIASALGAKVFPNPNREIGWFPVERSAEGENSSLKNIIPLHLEVFHWHGETFELPSHAVHLARSEGCENQAFCIGEHVLGLQFHLEATPLTVGSLIKQCQDDLVPGRYVQTAEEMLAVPSRFHRINVVMDAVLDRWKNHESKSSLM